MISFFEDYNTDLIVIIMFDKVLSLRRGGYAHEFFFGNKMEKLCTFKNDQRNSGNTVRQEKIEKKERKEKKAK